VDAKVSTASEDVDISEARVQELPPDECKVGTAPTQQYRRDQIPWDVPRNWRQQAARKMDRKRDYLY
jgi:hypothetical protein